MATRSAYTGILLVILFGACAKKNPPAPPAPPPQPQNIFALLPEADGKQTGIVVKNAAGQQEIDEPNHAVRVAGANVAPTPPFAIDEPTVKRLFGGALDAMPAAEQHFTLYFDLSQDVLTRTSQDQISAILRAIQERHSTNISVTGHADTKGDPAFNNAIARRRAQGVSERLRQEGVNGSYLFVTSFGDTDLLVKTGPDVSEPLNRRVEVIVR